MWGRAIFTGVMWGPCSILESWTVCMQPGKWAECELFTLRRRAAASWQAASSACLLDIPAVMDLESWVGQAFFSFSFGQGIFATLKEKKLSVVACPQCITFGRVCLSDSSPEATERGQRSGTLAPQGPSAPFHGLFCVQQFLITLHFPQQHRQIISAEQIRKQYFSFNPNVSWSEQPQQSVVPAWGQAMLTIQN